MRRTINLVSTKQSIPSWVKSFDQYLVMVNIVSIVVIALAAIVTTGGLVWSSMRVENATREKDRLISGLKQYESKESKYFLLKNRLAVIEKILKSQDPFTSHLDTAMQIAVPPQLASFSLTDKREVQIQVVVGSIVEGRAVIDKIHALVNEKRIINPSLTTVGMDGSGGLKLGVLYTVIR
jgi:hypothetical protein